MAPLSCALSVKVYLQGPSNAAAPQSIYFAGDAALHKTGASVIHGIHSLTDTHQVEGLFWTYLGENRVRGADEGS